jgi:hypothetical protein
MGIMEQAMNDIKQITDDLTDFATTVTFTSPTQQTATINCLYSDHTNAYDQDGMPINGKKTHITFAESLLTALNYPTRNGKGFISFTGHLVQINYADGTSKKYMVDDVRPDYTINLITTFLSEYATN